MSVKHQRHTREEWQQIIQQFQSSGQSGAAFCRTQNIPYASFCQWKQTLLGASAPAKIDFVDLQSLVDRGSAWKIVLRLGGDIELVLSQP